MAEIQYHKKTKKCILVGPNSLLDLCNYLTKVHKTYFLERSRNQPGNINFPFLHILSHSGDIRDQSREVVENQPKF